MFIIYYYFRLYIVFLVNIFNICCKCVFFYIFFDINFKWVSIFLLVVVIMLIVLEKIWRGGNRFFWLLVLEFWVLFFIFGEILVEVFLNFELFLEDDLFLVFILKIKYFWFKLNFVYLFWIVKCWYVFIIFFEVSEVCFVRLVFVVFFFGWDVIMLLMRVFVRSD